MLLIAVRCNDPGTIRCCGQSAPSPASRQRKRLSERSKDAHGQLLLANEPEKMLNKMVITVAIKAGQLLAT